MTPTPAPGLGNVSEGTKDRGRDGASRPGASIMFLDYSKLVAIWHDSIFHCGACVCVFYVVTTSSVCNRSCDFL